MASLPGLRVRETLECEWLEGIAGGACGEFEFSERCTS